MRRLVATAGSCASHRVLAQARALLLGSTEARNPCELLLCSQTACAQGSVPPGWRVGCVSCVVLNVLAGTDGASRSSFRASPGEDPRYVCSVRSAALASHTSQFHNTLLCRPSKCEGPETFWFTAPLIWAVGPFPRGSGKPDPSPHREPRLRSLTEHLVVAGEESPCGTSAVHVTLWMHWETPAALGPRAGPAVKLHEELGPWLCASPRRDLLLALEQSLRVITTCHCAGTQVVGTTDVSVRAAQNWV